MYVLLPVVICIQVIVKKALIYVECMQVQDRCRKLEMELAASRADFVSLISEQSFVLFLSEFIYLRSEKNEDIYASFLLTH